MDEGSRGQFLNIERTLINIQEEIEDPDLCQHKTLRPLLKQKSLRNFLYSLFLSSRGGEKTHFSFEIGGSYCEA